MADSFWYLLFLPVHRLSCPPFSLIFIAYATQLFVLLTVEHVFSVRHVFPGRPALPLHRTKRKL